MQSFALLGRGLWHIAFAPTTVWSTLVMRSTTDSERHPGDERADSSAPTHRGIRLAANHAAMRIFPPRM